MSSLLFVIKHKATQRILCALPITGIDIPLCHLRGGVYNDCLDFAVTHKALQ